jgi:adenylate kinase family enzyme
MTSSPGRRIVVIGTTGSGKTALARQIASRLAIPHVEIDALHWGPAWTPASTDVLRQRLAEAVRGDAWVVDGNYSKVRDLVWPRAEVVAWLDYALPVILWRLAPRTLRRLITKEPLWHDNRESWRVTFLTKDSLFVWALQTYRRHRREYPQIVAQPEHAHLALVRLCSPGETERWLASLGSHGVVA